MGDLVGDTAEQSPNSLHPTVADDGRSQLLVALEGGAVLKCLGAGPPARAKAAEGLGVHGQSHGGLGGRVGEDRSPLADRDRGGARDGIGDVDLHRGAVGCSDALTDDVRQHGNSSIDGPLSGRAVEVAGSVDGSSDVLFVDPGVEGEHADGFVHGATGQVEHESFRFVPEPGVHESLKVSEHCSGRERASTDDVHLVEGGVEPVNVMRYLLLPISPYKYAE